MIQQFRVAVFGGLLIAAAGVGPAQEPPAADGQGMELRDRPAEATSGRCMRPPSS